MLLPCAICRTFEERQRTTPEAAILPRTEIVDVDTLPRQLGRRQFIAGVLREPCAPTAAASAIATATTGIAATATSA
eukprot:5099180-Prorocentrum_lima.AAC.1